MRKLSGKKWLKRFLIGVTICFFLLFLFVMLFANRFVEPILRDRIHTLIIKGSDSLYTYQLGNLTTNFFGGNVEVENLHIRIDSIRYRQMLAENALPSLTMQMDLQHGHIKGISLISLLFGKKIKIDEIQSKEADVKLSRHVRKANTASATVPLWKSMQPTIKSISIDKVDFDGIKLLYRNADTSEAIKLQFDRCEALFKDIQIDSLASLDTSRIAFTKSIDIKFNDLKFRTPDSSYKMKAEVIHYSSAKKYLEIQDFKLQPTREEKEIFYGFVKHQQAMYVVEFKKIEFTNLLLDRFINNNIISADSILINQPEINIYDDKTLEPNFDNKVGKFPHQKLLKADALVRLKGIRISNGALAYTEKSEKTLQTGKLSFENLNAQISNITNDPLLIQKNNRMTASVGVKIFSTTPLQTKFNFYLDSSNGAFDVQGSTGKIAASQLNTVAVPLGNANIQSLNIHNMDFNIHADDFTAWTSMKMRYNNLSVVLSKTNEDNGAVTVRKFITKMLNRFVIYTDNPGSDGVERTADKVMYARITSKSFFGLIWKSLFMGMQGVMLKSGRYD